MAVSGTGGAGSSHADMAVSVQVPIREGSEGFLLVESHPTLSGHVRLSFGSVILTVRTRELGAAISNASNVPRY